MNVEPSYEVRHFRVSPVPQSAETKSSMFFSICLESSIIGPPKWLVDFKSAAGWLIWPESLGCELVPMSKHLVPPLRQDLENLVLCMEPWEPEDVPGGVLPKEWTQCFGEGVFVDAPFVLPIFSCLSEQELLPASCLEDPDLCCHVW